MTSRVLIFVLVLISYSFQMGAALPCDGELYSVITNRLAPLDPLGSLTVTQRSQYQSLLLAKQLIERRGFNSSLALSTFSYASSLLSRPLFAGDSELAVSLAQTEACFEADVVKARDLLRVRADALVVSSLQRSATNRVALAGAALEAAAFQTNLVMRSRGVLAAANQVKLGNRLAEAAEFAPFILEGKKALIIFQKPLPVRKAFGAAFGGGKYAKRLGTNSFELGTFFYNRQASNAGELDLVSDLNGSILGLQCLFTSKLGGNFTSTGTDGTASGVFRLVPLQSRLTLTWVQSSSEGITQNKIYRSLTGAAGPYALRATIPASTSYIDTGLNSGQSYFYAVTALNSSGEESDFSNFAGAAPR